MELSNVVNSEQIVELPLISRNFTGLELTLPGVQASSDRFGTYSVSGGQTQQSEFLINGADTNDIALNTLCAVSPNLDAIDQFNLIDGPLNAEYDRNSGGIVSATIKEGTNHFHGDAFEFYRDTFLNTLNYFQKSVTTGTGHGVSPYHQNIFGGTVGGPILHDKLFFFFALPGNSPAGSGYEWQRPVERVRRGKPGGDFSAEDNPAAHRAARPDMPAMAGESGQAIQFLHRSQSPAARRRAKPGHSAPMISAAVMPDFGNFNSIASNLVTKYIPTPNSGTYGLHLQPGGRLRRKTSTSGASTIPPTHPTSSRPWPSTTSRRNCRALPFTGATLPGFGDVSTHTIQQYTGDYVHQFNAEPGERPLRPLHPVQLRGG